MNDYNLNCRYCGKHLEEPKRELPVGDTVVTVHIPYCNKECEDKYEENEKQRQFETMLNEKIQQTLPAKFRDIGSDKKALIKQHYNKSLYIYGDIGVGKSVFMANMLKEYMKNLVETCWESYPAFVMKLKGMFREDQGSPYQLAGRIANFNGVVAIDDIGVEKSTEFVKEMTYYIINQREVGNRITLLTSNVHSNDLEDRVSSRIAGMCTVLKFSGKDRRKSK